MRWTIRTQILIPFAVVLLAAVALTAFSAAYVAAERAERDVNDRINRVMATLGRSDFPWSQNVVEMMRGLSRAEFVVWNADGELTASTLEKPVDANAFESVPVQGGTARKEEARLFREKPERQQDRESAPSANADQKAGLLEPALAERPLIAVNGERYFAAAYRRPDRGETLVVLYSEEQLRTARRAAAFPPLIVGGVTLVALVIVSAWLAHRFGRRIRNVQEQVAHIAGGEFLEMQPGKTRDEIFELVTCINRMSGKLRELDETIRQTERARLLGQLAGGLAHQLRNAITGARLAVQLHQRRCAGEPDESLDVALQELALTEEHVKRLLSVGKRDAHVPRESRLDEVLANVASLVSPICEHGDVTFRVQHENSGDAIIADADAVQTAVMNLVLNAAEATGPNGTVELTCRRIDEGVILEVSDDGPGPPEELRERLFDAFVTGKPEGVGLGLSLVKQVADALGGKVQWERRNGQTVFQLTLPVASTSVDRTARLRAM